LTPTLLYRFITLQIAALTKATPIAVNEITRSERGILHVKRFATFFTVTTILNVLTPSFKAKRISCFTTLKGATELNRICNLFLKPVLPSVRPPTNAGQGSIGILGERTFEFHTAA
jgi:hypothetical protein